MDTVIQAIEIFALVTGVVYLVLEILQKNSMWVVGILTSTACAFEFAITHVWASMGLNLYYVVVSVIGFIQWRKASEAVGEGEIHLGIVTDRFEEMHERHERMGIICFENEQLGVYFIEDPDEYWIEIIPER